MTAIIIIGIIFALLAAILFLPVGAGISFKESFVIKVKLWGLRVYSFDLSEKEKKEETEKEPQPEQTATEKKESFFGKLKAKFGFAGAVKQIFELALSVLSHIKKLLRHIKINKVILNLTVASSDAATTALEYGALCAAAYPVLALLSSVGNIKYKSVNINSDFNSDKPSFDFSLDISTRIFFLLLTALRAFKEYKNFTERIENNE